MLAVKLYGDVIEKPDGIPDSWPAEVRELDEYNSLPDDSGLWQVMTVEDFNTYKLSVKSEYDTWRIAKSTEKAIIKKTEDLMVSCISFGQGMMIRYSAENVRLGITADGQTGPVLTKLQPTLAALQSGSLLEAVCRIQAIPEEDYDSKYITAERVSRFVAEIHAFLGM
jgi:hypothetical protein